MRILVLDTSTERGIAACIDQERILFSLDLPPGLHNSRYLLPELQKTLKEKSVNLHTIECIVSGMGPGSYTGIRVGAIIAKTLSFANSIPLVGVCSLDAFVPDHNCSFAALIDAKIGGVYLQKGTLHQGKVESTPPMIVTLEQAAQILQDCTVLVTPQIEPLRTKLSEFLLPGHEWQERPPSATRMASVAMEKYMKGDYTLDGHLDLLYMRKTQAEIEKENRI